MLLLVVELVVVLPSSLYAQRRFSVQEEKPSTHRRSAEVSGRSYWTTWVVWGMRRHSPTAPTSGAVRMTVAIVRTLAPPVRHMRTVSIKAYWHYLTHTQTETNTYIHKVVVVAASVLRSLTRPCDRYCCSLDYPGSVR